MVSNPRPGSSTGFYFLQSDGGVYAFDGVPFLAAQSYEERTVRSGRPGIDSIARGSSRRQPGEAGYQSQLWDVVWHGVEIYTQFRSVPPTPSWKAISRGA